MKILLITLEYPPFKGGVANYYGLLAKYWPQRGGLDVVSNNKGQLCSGHFPIPWLKTIKLLWKKKKEGAFSYLLVGHILPLGTAAYITSFFKSFKYGIILHGLDFAMAIKTKRKRIITRLILKKADKIICANSQVAYLVTEFDNHLKEKITILNPGIEAVEIKPLSVEKRTQLRTYYQFEKDDIILFSVGRLVRRKGFDKVIETLARQSLGNIKYLIAGSGDDEEYLKGLVRQYQLQNKVIFLGSITDASKWQLFQFSDIFIMPAREIENDFEGFGIVYLEANLAGKPVIAGISGGVRDAVIHNKTGLLVNPENIVAIEKAIMSLSQDKELRLSLGKQGRERALNDFLWQRKAQEFKDLIDN
ncbi:MAG: glycosyltransferase family 4 protein [Patescibacteria group bacterium]|nr:glycosyltransferase family 4 protein [Patescibacteria group bacterium]MDD3777958.1 glycosyltransferase family 4 protein [Patescibacteria group bacterium]MDD3939111.1 glycosyltransferase family 4 protein [Patescibacteria group bacterium]MDD4443586.1 glycosyltransferase family 4 protein [Patescibacteria group bacterium]